VSKFLGGGIPQFSLVSRFVMILFEVTSWKFKNSFVLLMIIFILWDCLQESLILFYFPIA